MVITPLCDALIFELHIKLLDAVIKVAKQASKNLPPADQFNCSRLINPHNFKIDCKTRLIYVVHSIFPKMCIAGLVIELSVRGNKTVRFPTHGRQSGVCFTIFSLDKEG